MRPPCEIVVRHLLPVLRALVAQELIETYGWTQTRVAESLGITQPSVSGYLSLLRREGTSQIRVEEVEKASNSIASGIASKELTSPEAVGEVCELCMKLKSGGIVCEFHKQSVEELRREACETCLRIYVREFKPIGDRYEVLMDLKKAISLIEASGEFPQIMPEVRVNIVTAIPNAGTVSEVAGIPGRITKVRGRARAFLEPEFGASSHMAKVLLAAMKIDGRIRAAVNTRYNDAVDGVIKRLGYRVPQFDRTGLPEREARGESSTISGIKKALEECGRAAEAVIDRGGYGTEPVVYLFGGSAVEAARRAIEVAEEVAKAQQDK